MKGACKVAEDGLSEFKGIPFAAPPVGKLRWKAPQPVKPWSGVRQATAFGAACVQNPAPAWIYGGGFSGGMTSAPLYDGAH